MFRMAGFLGVEPDGYTLRELCWMYDGKEDTDWWHTAAIMSIVANSQRDGKKKPSPYTPEDFYPRKTKSQKAVAKVPIDILKKVFIDGNKSVTNQGRSGIHSHHG